MKKAKVIAIALGLMLGYACVGADQKASIRTNIAKWFGNKVVVDEVKPAPIGGLVEVRSGKDVIYFDETGQYLVKGHIYDAKDFKDLTQERLDEINKVDFSKLPFGDAIKIVRGNGKAKMAIFEDPNCGYCKRAETDYKTIDNITVYVFLIPILGENSVAKSKDIWCADNKGQAWQSWMIDGQKPASAKCDTNALTRNLKLAEELGIRGTPAIIFADGSRAPGAIPATEVQSRL